MTKKVGIAGLGSIGSAVAKALRDGLPGYHLHAAAEVNPAPANDIPLLDFAGLAKECDIVIEALPPYIVPALTKEVFDTGKDLMLISSSALLLYPEILEHHRIRRSRVMIPSGALTGLDGVRALAQAGIKSAAIASTKHPRGYAGSPYVIEKNIDTKTITERTKLFAGNALEAAKAFPSNVNVAATLSLAGIGPERTTVEIWADPAAKGNTHEITVEGEFSRIYARVENLPDPQNPKTSMLAAQSVIAALRGLHDPLVIL